MQFIDTHAHLYDPKYTPDLDAVVARAIQQGIAKIYLPNLNESTLQPMLAVKEKYPELCSAMLGLHPCDVKNDYDKVLQRLETSLPMHPFVAIGEVGIDLYWDTTYHKQQIAALHRAIDWALAYNLPLVLHSRAGFADLIEILKVRQNGNLTGILHCFSEGVTEAKQIIDLGFYIGIGGIVTFAKSHLVEVVRTIDLQYIVLETDSPYLAPTPYRGKRNEPAHIPLIATAIADIQGVSLAHIAASTTANAQRIFGK